MKVMNDIILSDDFGLALSAMQSCEQTSGINMIEHGRMVKSSYAILLDAISGRCEAPLGWRIPEWARNPNVLRGQFPRDIVDMYLLYHDCGKPLSRTVDEHGKVHYPEHAHKSQQLWTQLSSHLSPEQRDKNSIIARLMGMDMDIHTLKSDGVQEFAKRPEAMTLLLAGLAEVHANAGMFGGFDSVSFKIKVKHMEKRGRQVISAMS